MTKRETKHQKIITSRNHQQQLNQKQEQLKNLKKTSQKQQIIKTSKSPNNNQHNTNNKNHPKSNHHNKTNKKATTETTKITNTIKVEEEFFQDMVF